MATCLQFGSQIADFFDCLCAQSRASCKQEFCQKVNAPSMHGPHRPMHPPRDPRPHELTLFVPTLVRTRCSHTHAHTSRCSAPWPATGILRVRTMKPIIASDVARGELLLFVLSSEHIPLYPVPTSTVQSVHSLREQRAILVTQLCHWQRKERKLQSSVSRNKHRTPLSALLVDVVMADQPGPTSAHFPAGGQVVTCYPRHTYRRPNAGQNTLPCRTCTPPRCTSGH
jgi:hypothetical protein